MAHTRGGHMTVVSAIEAVDIWRENWVTDADNVTSRFTSYNLSSREHQLTAEVVVKMGWKFNGLTAKWKYFPCPQSKINQFPPKRSICDTNEIRRWKGITRRFPLWVHLPSNRKRRWNHQPKLSPKRRKYGKSDRSWQDFSTVEF